MVMKEGVSRLLANVLSNVSVSSRCTKGRILSDLRLYLPAVELDLPDGGVLSRAAGPTDIVLGFMWVGSSWRGKERRVVGRCSRYGGMLVKMIRDVRQAFLIEKGKGLTTNNYKISSVLIEVVRCQVETEQLHLKDHS